MKQLWEKQGLIYTPPPGSERSYAAVPVGYFVSENVIRIFYSSRDQQNRSHPYYLDYDMKTRVIVGESLGALLRVGERGAFDDSGVMPACLIKDDHKLIMYYTGWNLGVTVPFRNSIGMAVSMDDGESFTRSYPGPIVDRNKDEPHFVATPYVLVENGEWKMWYLSCIAWKNENEGLRHYYHIKYAVSDDGVNWNRNGRVAIDFQYENEYAISVPRVIREDNVYRMWYSYRGGSLSETYRIGYAESADGITWQRMDDRVHHPVSEQGWDSDMICYPFIFDHNGERYMLYNGNGYGKTGFGLAILKNLQ